MRLLLVCLGGALGSGARYLLTELAQKRFGVSFPWGTMFVNVVGSFLIGAILWASFDARSMSVEARLFLGTGIMGGFTTYSSFNAETIAMAREGRYGAAAAYVSATFVVALLAGVLGLAAGRVLIGRT